jgi:hypothetical protein
MDGRWQRKESGRGMPCPYVRMKNLDRSIADGEMTRQDRRGAAGGYGLEESGDGVDISPGNGLAGDSSSQRMLRTYQREPSFKS